MSRFEIFDIDSFAYFCYNYLMRDNIKSYSLNAMMDRMMNLDVEQYRAEQIFKWIWQKNAKDFSVMTNLSQEFRRELSQKFIIAGVNAETLLMAKDGSRKYSLKTEDAETIEVVFIPEGKRKTVCVSTQIGCPLGCQFCATGLMGLKRNLKAYEIADEIRIIQEDTDEKVTNIVFMGMGEPLLNLKEVMEAIEIIRSPMGLSVSQRHTTISTVGLIPGLEKLLVSSLKVKLAISLNFADQEMRKEMMPAARKNPLRQIIRLAREYSLKKNMVTFEYVLMDKVNDRIADARQLLRLLKGVPSKINLIPYNPHPLLPFKRPSDKKIQCFYNYLLASPHTITLRKSKGQEILAACGQLAVIERKK